MEDNMTNYFVVNKETGKLELHFDKATYQALDIATKKRIKSAFLWGRNSGCWISRCKEPNLYSAKTLAIALGLHDAGATGERLSFAEQMERKAERAERRADRYEARSEAAEMRGEALQEPINKMRGDIAFFTQPNINSVGGRAFTRRREKMFASFERGFEEFSKSAYWQERAEIARKTAGRQELKDKGFIGRRIAERESDIRKLKKSIEEYESFIPVIEAGEVPRDRHGWEVKISANQIQEQIEIWLDRLEAKLDELGFYEDCMDKLGGVQFSRDNIKVGYIVRFDKGRSFGMVTSVGPKNCVIKEDCHGFIYTPSVPYAEITEIVEATEAQEETHPFKVGEEFICSRWNPEKRGAEKLVYRIIKATDKSVTLQTGSEKSFVRKPSKLVWCDTPTWCIKVTDWHDGIIRKQVK